MTTDEKNGVDWWNDLSEVDRRFWLTSASTAVPAEAWVFFKAVRVEVEFIGSDSIPVGGNDAVNISLRR